MATIKKDYRGLKCPVPTLKMATVLMSEVKPGDLLEVTADCPKFEEDLKKFCAKWKKPLIKWVVDGDVQVATLKI